MISQQDHSERPNPPVPEKHPGRGSTPLSIASVVVSVLLIVYGVSVVLNAEGGQLQIAFALATIIYGGFGLGVLGAAYRYRSRWCVLAIQVGAICYLVIYVLAMVTSLLGGIAITGLFPLALALWCNWSAVSLVVRRKLRVEPS